MVIMPEDLERRRKPNRYSIDVLLGYNKKVEDEIYEQKIAVMMQQKMEKFARQDALAAEIKEREEMEKFARQVKESKKRKRITEEDKKIVPIVSNKVTQRLTQHIRNEMNGTEIKMVIQKPLFPSDLRKSQNRLNMPINQLTENDFLRKHEKQQLKNGLEVELLGPRLRVHKEPMVLKKWELQKSDNYVLINKWNNFVKENKKYLKERSMIQVWSFRKNEKLHFAIACLEIDVDQQNDAAAPPTII